MGRVGLPPISGRSNSSEYRKMERILDDLTHRKMMVFPFAGFFGRKSNFPTDADEQDQYVRYTLARLGAYWNVMFNVAGPEPLLAKNPYLTKTELDRLGQLIQRYDVFGHLLTVHNQTGDDQFMQDEWLSFTTLQGPKTIQLGDLYVGLQRNHHPVRPLYAQETLWSGNKFHPDYSDRQLRQNAWVLLMAAAVINFADNGGADPSITGDSSSGFSGTLHLADCRQARHALLKQVWDTFETFPFYEFSPHQELASAGYCLAKPGKAYLVYLPEAGSVDVAVEGGPYQVEWVNAAGLSERQSGGITSDGKGLRSPDGGEDWLVYLSQREES